jgi:hypothetical protein
MSNAYVVASIPEAIVFVGGVIGYGFKKLMDRLKEQDKAMVAQNEALLVIGTQIGQHTEGIKDLWAKTGKQDAAISALQASTTELATLVRVLTEGK